MSKLLFNRAFSEHTIGVDVSSIEGLSASSILFKQKDGCICIEITEDTTSKKLNSNYYTGTDWLNKNKTAVYVAPKINDKAQQTDYLRMLFSCLRHSDVASFTNDLYEIKFEEPFIEIEQKKDLITPLLIIQFLQILKSIVKKGLKKSYSDLDNSHFELDFVESTFTTKYFLSGVFTFKLVKYLQKSICALCLPLCCKGSSITTIRFFVT